jgi:hypothetical protein
MGVVDEDALSITPSISMNKMSSFFVFFLIKNYSKYIKILDIC